MDNIKNNGGKTDYYDLPQPEIIEIIPILNQYANSEVTFQDAANLIIELFPQTLNDLIEYKDMRFWTGEAFKTLYALHERSMRSCDDNSSIERELNKVIYYCVRGLNYANSKKIKRST